MLTPDPPTIARIARAALADQAAHVTSWERAPLSWVPIAATTSELTRYSGKTDDGRTWSAVLKVLRRPERQTTQSWRREADVYGSGILDTLPPGIAAPRAYGIDEADAQVALWLEDVVETTPVWPLARYAVAAYDLGRFNGAYLAGWPRPDVLPLGSDWLARWVAGAAERAPRILGDDTVTEHDLVRNAVRPAEIERLGALCRDRGRLLTALDKLPPTVSHLDAWRANLMARDTDAATQTVAIDWSLLGLAPPGQELAVFVTGSRAWLALEPYDAEAIGDLSLRSYIDGLRAAGWAGREHDVRFAYAASVALWAGIAAPIWLQWFTLPERREWLERKFGMPLEIATEPFGRFIVFALDRADEALADPRG